LKSPGKMELLKLVWSKGGPRDSLKVKEITDLISAVLRALGNRTQVEAAVENINAFTAIFYAVYADPKTRRIPTSIVDTYRDLILAEYAQVLGKTRMDADRRLELFGSTVQGFVLAFGSDAAAKYLGEVSAKLGNERKLSSAETRAALKSLLGLGSKLPLRNSIVFPFYEGAPSAYSGTLSECMARSLSHGAQFQCAIQASHHLDRPIMEWALVNTPQVVALGGRVDMQRIWRDSFDDLAEAETKFGKPIGDREWLLRFFDSAVSRYREVFIRLTREALGAQRSEGTQQLGVALDRFANYLSEAKLGQVMRVAIGEELPEVMNASRSPEMLEILGQLGKPSHRYPDFLKAEALVAGVFRRLFLDPEFQAVFVAAAEDIRTGFLDRASRTLIPPGSSQQDRVRREAMIERIRKEVTTASIVEIIFQRLKKTTGVERNEDIDPLKAFVALTKKSEHDGDRSQAEDLVLGIVSDMLARQELKMQALGHVLGALLLGPDGDELLDQLVEKESLPAFNAFLAKIEAEYGASTRHLMVGLSKAYDSAIVRGMPHRTETIAKYVERLNARSGFEMVQDFAKPLVKILAFQVDCGLKPGEIPGCLRPNKTGVLVTDGNERVLFSKELSQLVLLLRSAARAQVVPPGRSPGKKVVASCRAAVDLTLERFPTQIVGNEVESLSQWPLYFMSRVVKDDAALEPSVFACAQVGIVGSAVRPALERVIWVAGLGGETREVLSDQNLYSLVSESGALGDLNRRFREELSTIFASADMGGAPIGDRIQSAVAGYAYQAGWRAPLEPSVYGPYRRALLTESQIRWLDRLFSNKFRFKTVMNPAEIEELEAKLPQCTRLLSQEMLMPFAAFGRLTAMEILLDPLATADKRVIDVAPKLPAPGTDDKFYLPPARGDRVFRALRAGIGDIDARLGCKDRSPAVGRFRQNASSFVHVIEPSSLGDITLAAVGMREVMQRTLELKSSWGALPLGWDQAFGTKMTDSPYYAGNWLLSFRERFFALRKEMEKHPSDTAKMEAACEAARRCE